MTGSPSKVHQRVTSRTLAARAAVVDAAYRLIDDVGYGGFTIDEVARRSGVAKTTIYRHWASRDDLLLDVAASVLELDLSDPSDDPAEDIAFALSSLSASLAQPTTGRLVLAALTAATGDAEFRARALQRLIDPVLIELSSRLEATASQGTPFDRQLTSDLLGGLVVHRSLVTARPLQLDEARAAVTALLVAPATRAGVKTSRHRRVS
jgi:AcrR family transcriptional regulator